MSTEGTRVQDLAQKILARIKEADAEVQAKPEDRTLAYAHVLDEIERLCKEQLGGEEKPT